METIEVRTLVGRLAGQVIEMPKIEAEAALASGTAVPPEQDVRVKGMDRHPYLDMVQNPVPVPAKKVKKTTPAPETYTDLPADWRGQHWMKRAKIARDLTGREDIKTAEEADKALAEIQVAAAP